MRADHCNCMQINTRWLFKTHKRTTIALDLFHQSWCWLFSANLTPNPLSLWFSIYRFYRASDVVYLQIS